MGLIVDTNIFIDAENGRFDLSRLEQYAGHGDAYIAAITVAELYLGVHLAANDDSRVRREAIVGSAPSLAFTEDVARVYSRLYALFLKPRSKAGSNVHDLQIAATAVAYGYPVLTSNKGDFQKIPGVQVLTP